MHRKFYEGFGEWGKRTCFIKAVLHMVNESEQRETICNNLRLIPSNEVQTVFRLSPSLFSHFHRFRRAAESASFPPGEAKLALYEFALVRFKWDSAYRRKPLRRCAPPQPCIKQLYAVEDGYTC